MTQKVFVTSLFVLLLSTVESKKSMMKEVHSIVSEIKDAVIQGGPGPVLPTWPCVDKNLDCRKDDNIIDVTILHPFQLPNILEQECNDFCRTFGDCEFWTLDESIFPIRCFALTSCANIKTDQNIISGPRECIYPKYKGGCPFCPWSAPNCYGFCSYTHHKCFGTCVLPQSISNDEVCTDIQAKAQYGECADSCHEQSDDCKECIVEKTSAYNCGGKFASCNFIDLAVCGVAVVRAYEECKNAGSNLEILKCIAEKVASNSACKNCFCDAVCKFSQELCDICSTITLEYNFVTVLPKILIQADPGLEFSVTLTTISYQDAPVCPSVNKEVNLSPKECAPAITRGNCLVTSIQAVKKDSPDTSCKPFVSNEGSNESRFMVEADGTNGCKVVPATNSC